MSNAAQFYPRSRTDRMSLSDLESVQRFALDDAAETSFTTVYAGMDRADTGATARRTILDTQAAIGRIHAALVPAW